MALPCRGAVRKFHGKRRSCEKISLVWGILFCNKDAGFFGDMKAMRSFALNKIPKFIIAVQYKLILIPVAGEYILNHRLRLIDVNGVIIKPALYFGEKFSEPGHTVIQTEFFIECFIGEHDAAVKFTDQFAYFPHMIAAIGAAYELSAWCKDAGNASQNHFQVVTVKKKVVGNNPVETRKTVRNFCTVKAVEDEGAACTAVFHGEI